MIKFEFSKEQNEIFASLSQQITVMAIIWAALGLMAIVTAGAEFFLMKEITSASDLAKIIGFVGGSLCLVLAYFTYKPVDNFKNIINSEGKDISELLIAIDDLSQSFNVSCIAMGFMVLVVSVRLVLSLMG